MEAPLIEFKEVTKRFGNRTILDRVNLEIYEGHVTTVIGKSGTGKSVLVKHIIGLLTPDEGSILFRGKPIEGLGKKEWDTYRSQISYMFQNNALFDSMTVFENIALPLRETTKMGKKEIEDKVMARIEQMELSEVAHKYPSELSGGMQKRVALGRALVTDPKIVLFDEPTTGQDPVRKNAILGMIAEYHRRFGFTAVMISHEIPDVFFVSNRILVLYEGKIIFQGTPEEMERFDHPAREEFINSLEGLEDELTGLYSRRHFKLRYQAQLSRKHANQGFTVVAFRVDNLDLLSQNMGHEVAQEVLKNLGNYLNEHLSPVGGFSARTSKGEVQTVLPFSDRDEAQQILDHMSSELQEVGLCEIQTGIAPDRCFEFSILAGLAEGQSEDEIDRVFEKAASEQKTIARYQCETR
jgi:phospholipid/cholesterol/gamma-HCH transport system ATP-binding protein